MVCIMPGVDRPLRGHLNAREDALRLDTIVHEVYDNSTPPNAWYFLIEDITVYATGFTHSVQALKTATASLTATVPTTTQKRSVLYLDSAGNFLVCFESDMPTLTASASTFYPLYRQTGQGWIRWQPVTVTIIVPIGDFGLMDVYSEVLYDGIGWTNIRQVGASSTYTSKTMQEAGTLAPYPGNASGLVGNGNTMGVSRNQIAGNGNNVLLLVTPEDLFKVDMGTDITTVFTSVLANIPVQNTCTHRGIDAVAYGPDKWWALLNEWQPDTVQTTHGIVGLENAYGNVYQGQYLMSSPDLITWTLERTIYFGAGENQDTVAIGLGPSGTIILVSEYEESHAQPTSVPFVASLAIAQGGGTAVSFVENYRSEFYYAISKDFSVYGSRQNGYFIGDRYNIPMTAGFGGGKYPPFLAGSNQQFMYLVDVNGGIEDSSTFVLSAACSDDTDSNRIYGINIFDGNVYHRAGPAGATWDLFCSGLTSPGDTVLLFQWSLRQSNRLICVHGQGGSIQVSKYEGGVVTHYPMFPYPVNDYYTITDTTLDAQLEGQQAWAGEG